MSAPPWRVRVTIGSQVLSATRKAEGDPEPTLPALTACRWTNELDAELWPAFEAVGTCRLSVVYPTAQQAAGIAVGTPLILEYFSPATATTPTASWHGRVSDTTIAPHSRGVVVELVGADYMADLAELTVGDVAYPTEPVEARVDRMLDEVGVGRPLRPYDTALGDGSWNRLRPPDAAGPFGYTLGGYLIADRARGDKTLLAALREVTVAGVWSSAAYTSASYSRPAVPPPWAQLELRPNLTSAGLLNTAQPLRWQALERAVRPSTAPGRLALVGGTWQLVVESDDPGLAGVVIPADATAFAAVWSRRKVTDYNTVTITAPGVGTAGGITVTRTNRAPGALAITERRESVAGGQFDVADLADFLVAGKGETPGSAWEAETFTVLLDHAPAGYWPGRLRQVAVIAGIQARHHPEAVGWYQGVVARLEVELVGGTGSVTVGLVSRPLQPPTDGLTWDELAAGAGPTFDQLGLTWDQLQNARTLRP